MPRDDLEDLARAAYVAHNAVRWRDYAVPPMPPWEELPSHLREPWFAAARAVVQSLAEKVAEA